MYKFADGQGGCYSASATWTAAACTPEAPHNSAYGFDLGGVYGGFSADVVVQRVNQANSVLNPLLGPTSLTQPYQSTTDSINTNPINGTNLIGTDNTEYGIVTDNTAVMVAAKYIWDPLKFFGGYEYIRMVNPTNPLGVGATAQGGYLLSGVEDNNLDSPKIVQVFWTGVKYAYDRKTEITLSYYHEAQNDFRLPRACSPAAGFRSSCAGHARRGLALCGPPLHQAFRSLWRHRLFRRHRRSGHRHSSRARRPLFRRQQHRADRRGALRLLIVSRGRPRRRVPGATALARLGPANAKRPAPERGPFA